MSDYPYVNSVLQAIEHKILDKAKFARLAKTSKQNFVKTLIDLGYGDENKTEVEDLITSELLSVKDLINELTPEKKYSDLFFLASDAINIKFLYKQKVFGTSHFDVFVPMGSIEESILSNAILKDDLTKLPKGLRKLFIKINHVIKDIDNPRLFSALIEQAIFDYVFDHFNLLTNSALSTYFKTYIDLQNVLSLFRAKAMNWDAFQLSEMLNARGTIKKDVFIEAYPLERDALMKAFSEYYHEKITKIIKYYYENPNLDQFRILLDQLLLDEMAMFKHDAFNIGPMIYYYLLKEAEALNIRILYTSEKSETARIIEY